MREQFISKKFSKRSLAIITCANAIIEEYQAQRLRLTLRQLYYQFVSRDVIPNKQSEYKNLGSIINDGRLAGLIDWDSIEDRTRSLKTHDGCWNSPDEIIQVVAKQYHKPYWENQPYYVEVWVEKEALAGVVEIICNDLKVSSFACKGYTSQSEMYVAGKRLAEALKAGKQVKIVHLGDHDPSGIDMTRDITDRLSMFSFPRECNCDLTLSPSKELENACDYCFEWYCRKANGEFVVDIERIALNFDQIKKYNPPPNPAKTTDCRFDSYAEKYGDSSWELDALEPSVLKSLIKNTVEPLIDVEEWEKVQAAERQEREILLAISNNFDDIRKQFGNEDGDL